MRALARVRRALSCAVLLLATAACGGADQDTTDEASSSGESTTRQTPFEAPELSWAQGSQLHYGDEAFDVGPGSVRSLWRTPHGFVLSVKDASDPDAAVETYFFDGQGQTRLPGRPGSIAVSPDGRYAGWIDFDGPRRLIGRLAEVVVQDLVTGKEVVRNHDNMGGATDDLDSLYSNAEVRFLGFDETHAYWQTPTGKVTRWRARLDGGAPLPAERISREGPAAPVGRPWDSLVGLRSGMLPDGRLAPDDLGPPGFASPDRRWCLTTGHPGRLPVVDCRTGARSTPTYPDRRVSFGGWRDADTFYVLAVPGLPRAGDRSAPDRSTGVMASCDLPGGQCRTLRQVTGTESFVWATGEETFPGY